MIRKNLTPVLIATFAITLSIIPSIAKLKTVTEFDVDRYLGVWHEAARLPVFYQRGCVDSKAIYKRVDAENYSVTNVCDRNGKTVTINGDAITNGIGKFRVTFVKFFSFKAEYWVLWVDENYQTAVVGVPKGNRVWILSRSKELKAVHRDTVMQVLLKNGYNPDELLWNGK